MYLKGVGTNPQDSLSVRQASLENVLIVVDHLLFHSFPSIIITHFLWFIFYFEFPSRMSLSVFAITHTQSQTLNNVATYAESVCK